jgi:hypothetical protein
MKIRYSLFSGLLFMASTTANAQLIISATGVPVTENFSTFSGSGFSANPTLGQLSSNTWRVTGLSDGDLTFRAEGTTGDFAKGASNGGVTAGGIYAFNSGLTNGVMVGVQPSGNDFTPGSIIVKVTNNSSTTISALQINYGIMVLNDQARSSSVNMSYSLNDADFTAISALGYNTPEAADTAGWTTVNKSFLLTGLNVGIGSSIYLSWDSDDVSGSVFRDEFGIDNISITAVETGANPIVSFAKATMLVSEGQTTFTADVIIDGSYPNQTSVEVAIAGGTATNPSDYVFVSPTTVIFAANDSSVKSITVVITNDGVQESLETIEFQLQNATNNATIVNGDLVVNIQDDDIFIPNYTIDEINDVDGNGLIDSAGVYCRIHAYVYGVNLTGTGLQFFVNDLTGGLQVFDGANNLGYNVSSGDSVRIIGAIGQFNGQLQMIPDSIVLLSQNNGLPAPQVVISLDESLEGELVQINCVSLDDVQAWDTGNGSGFTVTVNNGQSNFEVRIDDQSELFNATAPDFTFNLVGVVGQFDGDDPRDEGYQIYPWSNFQVQNTLKADFSFDITAKTVDFTSTSIGAIIHTWSFDDLSPTRGDINPTHFYDADGDYDVLLTVQNTDACVATVTKTVVINTTSINEYSNIQWEIYPTLVESELNVSVASNQARIKIYTIDGKEVLRESIKNGTTKVDVSAYGSGLYYTKICVYDKCETRKWIKK